MVEENIIIQVENMCRTLQPHYDELNLTFSKSYLSGSCWYVGENLIEWWRKCDNIHNFRRNVKMLMLISAVVENKLQCSLKLLIPEVADNDCKDKEQEQYTDDEKKKTN